MSRIGRMPIAVPAGVTVDIAENNHVTVKGPKGTLERTLPSEMEIKLEGSEIIVTRPNDLKKMKSLHGLTRTLLNNMVVGVTEGYKKELEVNGVGYRASKAGKVLTLNLGYSHPVEMTDPEGLESAVDGNKIIVSGIDKEKAIEYTKEHEVSDMILKTVAGAANCKIDFAALKQEGGNSMWSVFEETAKEGEARGSHAESHG